ncbi:GumC family protein [Altererythrobacter sp. Root672]|uniref:GumC family protein n=1 Tax=Altererythrobacter sp. Root672 TaxID=1736584 RepID=UPI000A5F1031|nr:AAA family ATPase [Altererythrobacter sp. Root672]
MDALTSSFGRRAPEPGLIDIRGIASIIRRRGLAIAAVMGIAFLSAIIAYTAASPTYSATAQVAIERQVEDLVPVESTRERPAMTDSSTVDTEVQILQSPTIAAGVVDQLDLARRPGFGFAADGQAPGADALPAARARAIDVVRNGLDVRREGTSYAIGISFAWGDPQTPTDIVNTAAKVYLDSQRQGLSAETNEQVALLAERLEMLREDVQQAEAAVATYRDQTNLVDIYNDNATAQQQIATINGMRAQAQSQQAAAASRAASGRTGDVAGVLDSPVISQLRTEEARLVAKEASMSVRYGPNYPEMAPLHEELAVVRSKIAEETGRLSRSLTAEARAVGSQAGSLSGSVGEVIGNVRAGNRASVQLADLQRNAEAARVLYSAMLERYRQAIATQGTERGSAYIVSLAPVPRAAISPNLSVYLLVGILAGLAASAVIVLLLEMLERGVRTRRELETSLGVPVLASAPDLATVNGGSHAVHAPLEASDYALTNSGSLFGETFRSIRTVLRIGRGDRDARSVAVISSIPHEGKTTIALTLARTTAKLGQRVVLVDCDERQRGSSREFRPGPVGLAQVLAGTATLEDALIIDLETGLSVLPQLTGDDPDYDMFASDKMQQLIDTLEQRFDLVVIDTAPVLQIAEARALAAMADKTLFVMRWRDTPVHTARMALDLLERSGADVAGAVLNMVDIRAQAKSSAETHLYREYEKEPA